MASGLALPVDAAIYKWKDENGKTHFTDDITKVPEAFQKKPFLKNPRFRKEAPKTTGKAVQGKEVSDKQSATEKPAEPEKKVGNGGLAEAHRTTAETAVNFLEEDISRYDKIYTWPSSRSKFRALKAAVASATSQKQTLLEQVRQHDLPLFEEITEFLQTSIAKDEKAQKVMPTTIVSTRQTQILINRLKSETQQEKQFLEKLGTALTD